MAVSFGIPKRQFDYRKPPQEAFEDLQKALARIGSVESADRATWTVKGKCKYHWQTVRIKATVSGGGGGAYSTITLTGKGEGDFFERGARDFIHRLAETLQNVDDPDYQPQPAGTSPAMRPNRIAGFFALMAFLGGLAQALPPGPSRQCNLGL